MGALANKGTAAAKGALLVLFVAVLLLGSVASAAAVPPSVVASDGASAWSYRDIPDAVTKREGGYLVFSGSASVTLTVDDGAFGSVDTVTVQQGYTTSPHGGYDTTTNKCEVCHAAHRAQGAYYILRAESQDDACVYCHVGGSAHSSSIVYDLNPDGIYTTNGHTMGAQAQIPDSTTRQEAQSITLTTTDATGDPVVEVIRVRAYEDTKNSLYRFARHHAHAPASASEGYTKIGPLALSCMSCHQVHNATDEVWRPIAWQGTDPASPVQNPDIFEAAGYKLLKRYPSGSTAGVVNANGFYEPGQRVKALEGNAVVEGTDGPWGVEIANYSNDYSSKFTYSQNGEGAAAPIWIAQQIRQPSATEYPAEGTGYFRYPYFNSKYALSYWCADCHNLNIGGWEPLSNPELGFKAHTERTHPAPFYGAYTGPAQCYSCHRNDLSPRMNSTMAGGSGRATVAGRDTCTQCHFGTKDYAIEMGNESVGGIPNSLADLGLDFPHSGRTTDLKLLGSYSTSITAGGGTIDGATAIVNTIVTEDSLDAVCLRCHSGVGVHQ